MWGCSGHLHRLTGWKIGPDRDVVPCIQVATQGVELLVRQAQSVLTEEQMVHQLRNLAGG